MELFKEIEDRDGKFFVIGDVHGCGSELRALLDHILVGEGFNNEKDHLLFIGDYIDRGRESREVLEQLLTLKGRLGEAVTFLKGNHEDMFLSFLGFKGQSGDSFIHNGGDKTLKSYGLSGSASAEEVRLSMPEVHVSFLLELSKAAIYRDFICVHAGLNPLAPISAQQEEELYWIREDFIFNEHSFNKTVIFGHTPFEDLMFHLPYKIGIDTGCVYGNALTAIELSGDKCYQVGLAQKKVYESSFKSKIGEGTRPKEMKVD